MIWLFWNCSLHYFVVLSLFSNFAYSMVTYMGFCWTDVKVLFLNGLLPSHIFIVKRLVHKIYHVDKVLLSR